MLQPAATAPSFFARVLPIVTLCAFAIAQPLYDLLAQHPEFFIARQSQANEIWALIALLSLAIPALIILLETVVSWICRLLRLPVQGWIRACLVAALTALIVLPILKRVDLLSDSAVVWSAVAIGLVVAAGYTYAAGLRRFLSVLSLAAIIFPVIFVLSPGIKSTLFVDSVVVDGVHGGKIEVPDTASVSSALKDKALAPIVMLVFDELPSTSLMTRAGDIDDTRFPHFAALAGNAHWFRNATTVADSTLMALPAILTGQRPTPGKLATSAHYPNNLFTWLNATHTLNVNEQVTRLCPDTLCEHESQLEPFSERFDALVDDLEVVYQHTILPPAFTAHLPNIDYTWKNFGDDSLSVDSHDLAKQAARKMQVDRHQHFNDFVSSINQQDTPGFHFFHSMLPHSPFDYLPDGKLYGVSSSLPGINKGRWTGSQFRIDQAYQRHLLQVGFVDTLLGRLVNRLKVLQMYDESIIIVLSDHGVNFDKGSKMRAVSDANVHNIIPVPLFIKLANQSDGEIHDHNTTLLDIAPTIAQALGRPLPWKADGIAALNHDGRDTTKEITYKHGTKSVTLSQDDLVSRRQAVIERKTAILDTADETPGLLADPALAALIGSDVNVLSKGPATTMTAVIDQQSFTQAVDQSGHYLPVRLSGRVNFRDNTTPERLAISVNNQLWAVDTPVRLQGDTAIFNFFVPESAFNDGKNDVTVLSVEGQYPDKLAFNPIAAAAAPVDAYSLDTNWLGKVKGLRHRNGKTLALTQDVLDGWLDQVRLHDSVVMFSGWAATKDRALAVDQIALFVDGDFLHAGRPNLVRIDVQLPELEGQTQRAGFRFEMAFAGIKSGITEDVRAFAISKLGDVFELQYPDTFQWLQQAP